MSTPGREGGAESRAKAVHNRGEHSSSWSCTVLEDAAIAVCRGDGRDKSGFPFPRISRPGAEGGDDRHPKMIHNHGEDSFPWLCLVFRVVGCSIGRLTARALSRSPAISRPVLRKVLAREKWPDWCERPRSRFLHGFQDVGQTRNLTIESASLERAWEIALIVD